jgi:flagellar hook-length control protein FliK
MITSMIDMLPAGRGGDPGAAKTSPNVSAGDTPFAALLTEACACLNEAPAPTDEVSENGEITESSEAESLASINAWAGLLAVAAEASATPTGDAVALPVVGEAATGGEATAFSLVAASPWSAELQTPSLAASVAETVSEPLAPGAGSQTVTPTGFVPQDEAAAAQFPVYTATLVSDLETARSAISTGEAATASGSKAQASQGSTPNLGTVTAPTLTQEEQNSVAVPLSSQLPEAGRADSAKTVIPAISTAPAVGGTEPAILAETAPPQLSVEAVEAAGQKTAESVIKSGLAPPAADPLTETPEFEVQAAVIERPETRADSGSAKLNLESPLTAPAGAVETEPGQVASLRSPETVSGQNARVTAEPLTIPVVRNVRYLVSNGQHRITVRLVPESLGELHLEVQSSGGQTSVRLVSANPMVRGALEAQTPELKDALAREGLQIGTLEIASTLGQAAHSGSQPGFTAYHDVPPRPGWDFSRLYQGGASDTAQTVRRGAAHQGVLDLLV